MAACFQLISKATGKAASLSMVDDLMREHFGAPPSADSWFDNWYNSIGFAIACGGTFDTCRTDYADSPLRLQIIDWLESRFTTDAWFGR